MKIGKYAKYYAIATQGIVSMIVLLLAGFFIGRAIDKDSIWPGILAAIGAIIGLILFIITLLKLMNEEDKKKDDTEV